MTIEELTAMIEDLRKRKHTGSSCLKPWDVAKAFNNLVEELATVLQSLETVIVGGPTGQTTPVYILRALVAKTGGIAVPDPGNPDDPNHNVPFDSAVDLFTYNQQPSGITSGVAKNVDLRAFQDNEPVRLVSFDGEIWLPNKISNNALYAQVESESGVASGQVTFDFYNAIAIGNGTVPENQRGKAINLPGNTYGHDEIVVLEYVENPQVKINAGLSPDAQVWAVIQDDDDVGGGGGTETVNAKIGWVTGDAGVSPATYYYNPLTGILRGIQLGSGIGTYATPDSWGVGSGDGSGQHGDDGVNDATVKSLVPWHLTANTPFSLIEVNGIPIIVGVV